MTALTSDAVNSKRAFLKGSSFVFGKRIYCNNIAIPAPVKFALTLEALPLVADTYVNVPTYCNYEWNCGIYRVN